MAETNAARLEKLLIKFLTKGKSASDAEAVEAKIKAGDWNSLPGDHAKPNDGAPYAVKETDAGQWNVKIRNAETEDVVGGLGNTVSEALDMLEAKLS